MKSKVVCGFRYRAIIMFLFAFVMLFAPAALATSIPAADIDFALAFVDSAKADSIFQAALRDEAGEDFSSLFDGTETGDGIMSVDTTFAWNNVRVNAGRFDWKSLGPEDTIRIPLVDSANGKYFSHPFQNYVTSRFGLRRFMWHYGIDIKLRTGDTLASMLDGKVRVVQFDRHGYGHVVVVRHHNGLETVYAHMSRVLVRPNQLVRAGDVLGLGGNTGRSAGSHLHFEIRYFGEPFNPELIVNFDGPYVLKTDTLVLTRENFVYLEEARRIVVHTVRRGDNLSSIARRYGTTVNNLCRLNAIGPKTALRVGRRVVIRNGQEAEKQLVSNSTPPMNAQVPADAHSDDVPDTLEDTGGPEGGIEDGDDDGIGENGLD